MSPEQARGEDADGRSDLFSFGLVLYEMATGVRAFSGATHAVIFEAILNRQPTPLRQVNPSLPQGLVWVIERSLQKRPEGRYPQASDLLADLRAVQSGSGSERVTASGRVAKALPSIAVLAFVDMSPQKDQD